jgi:hypothetical protein
MPDYFGFNDGSNRSMIVPLYARAIGATQDEVNERSRTLGSKQEGYYRMLGKAREWGHCVVWWDDVKRGRVFKLKYNPKHSARNANAPPRNWEEMNTPAPPPGVTPSTWEGRSI